MNITTKQYFASSDFGLNWPCQVKGCEHDSLALIDLTVEDLEFRIWACRKHGHDLEFLTEGLAS